MTFFGVSKKQVFFGPQILFLAIFSGSKFAHSQAVGQSDRKISVSFYYDFPLILVAQNVVAKSGKRPAGLPLSDGLLGASVAGLTSHPKQS